MKRGLLISKKASNALYYSITFLIVVLLFSGAIFYFIKNSSSGALIYEETYSKQISLLIDKSRPGTNISINFENPLKVAEKNNFDKNKIVSFDSDNGEVTVKLNDRSGYKTRYFSNYKIEKRFDGNNLILEINKNEP
mgnify:CR=1 FL=1